MATQASPIAGSLVSLCIVSHSAKVAAGAAEMAGQMAGPAIRIAFVGGDPDGGLGTDVAAIMDAIQSVRSPTGVAILFDLGGAETNAEMAAEMLDDGDGPIRLCPGPVVEGAVLAAAEASGGASLDAVVGAVSVLRGGDGADGGPGPGEGPGEGAVEDRVVINHRGGLHARPSVKLVQTAKRFDAGLWVGPADRDAWARADSLSQVLGLKLPDGTPLRFRAEGRDAEAAVAAAVACIRALPPDEEPAADQPAAASSGPLVASAGLAIGPLWTDAAAVVDPPPLDTPAAEQHRLADAVAAAKAELAALDRDGDGLAGAVLAVQAALLDDRDLMAPIEAAVADGTPAAEAWRQALSAMAESYAASDDAYFAARAVDVADLRDRVLRAMAGEIEPPAPPDGAIVLADDLTPSQFVAVDWSRLGGIALRRGSPAGHVAMLATARAVPMVVALGDAPAAGRIAVLDAEAGRLLVDPPDAVLADYRHRLAERRARRMAEARRLAEPAVTQDGRRIEVLVNVDDPSVLDGLDPAHGDGIGLARTEFLFQGDALPDEDTQVQAYRRLLDWAGGRPVTIRTLDIGGDKPFAGLTRPGENNPFLGLRGLRLSLARPDVFRVQLRALARCAPLGPLKVMLPMVTAPRELAEARTLFQAVVDELRAEGHPAALPPLGIMVEVPAAALSVADFDADFFSIGTNDLVQYVTAVARDDTGVAALYDPLSPAVLRLIRDVAAHGAATGRPVSVCGDMAARPEQLAALLKAGVTSVSVAAGALAGAKAVIAGWAGAG